MCNVFHNFCRCGICISSCKTVLFMHSAVRWFCWWAVRVGVGLACEKFLQIRSSVAKKIVILNESCVWYLIGVNMLCASTAPDASSFHLHSRVPQHFARSISRVRERYVCSEDGGSGISTWNQSELSHTHYTQTSWSARQDISFIFHSFTWVFHQEIFRWRFLFVRWHTHDVFWRSEANIYMRVMFMRAFYFYFNCDCETSIRATFCEIAFVQIPLHTCACVCVCVESCSSPRW